MVYKSVLEWAVTQIGTHNDADGSNKYNKWYFGYRAVAPWCAVFITYGFNEVGILDRLNGLTNKAGCEPWRRWAVSKGYWSTQPKVGSIVLFDWNPAQGDGADHIGIVEKIVDGGIITIEGNTSADGGSQINGGYVMRKFRESWRVMGYVHVDTNAVRPKPKPIIGFSRYSGIDRYNTSKATANTFGESNNAVVLVNGKTFADALSASYFAQRRKSPILLTAPEVVNDTVRYIKGRGNIETVHIIGGEAAIPVEIEEKLSGYNINRIAGKTRYETNLSVLEASDTPNKQLLIVSGQNYPDGLCAGMINRPAMLVNKKLSDAQIAWIRERGLDTFYVIGGESAVSKEAFKQLEEIGEATRFAGDNRYATSRAVARTFFPLSDTVVFASGKTFADGISASNLGSYPLLLIDTDNTAEARRYVSALKLKRAFVVGGKGTLADNAVDWALTPLEGIKNV